ncbi:MAG: DUF3071 domain-containing protein [Actinomycetia bacterium]|nr:DUF3071 domain-containing protein [Actinomycetes bacterium]
MRELKVVGLDTDTRQIICESADSGEQFALYSDARLEAAVRGEHAGSSQTTIDVEVPNMLHPRDIQAKIRSGASIQQVAKASGASISRVERFAHPVLLERARAAELATAAHPVLPDGPSVLTLRETVSTELVARGLDPEATAWDAWRNEDGRWTVQIGWTAGRSELQAHFRFAPGAHGGTVTAFDDAAHELIDPNFARPLRPLAPVAQLSLDEPDTPLTTPTEAPEPPPTIKPPRPKKGRPAVPAWEDVLLGVRSSGGQS